MRFRIAAVLASLLCALSLAASANAAFSGKNGKIAYDKYDGAAPSGESVYMVNPDGTGDTRLVSGSHASWSPDGTRIAFERGVDIYVARPDGSDLVRLTDDAAWDRDPSWSPDGRVVFYSNRGEAELVFRIWVVNADGSGLRTLGFFTSPDVRYMFPPVFAPDGSRIAFGSRRSPHLNVQELYVMSADGSNQTRVTHSVFDPGEDPQGVSSADWSPDGTKLAFAQGAVFTIDPDGTALRGVVSDAADVTWSPDGTQIAFDRSGLLFTVGSDGTGLRTVFPYDPYEVIPARYNPSWQPIPGPKRSDYKNAAQFCKAERDFLGEQAFGNKYGTSGNGANAYGKCVSQNH